MTNKWSIRAAFPEEHFEITPDDDVDLKCPMIIYAITDGDVAITDKAGTTIIYTVLAGWTSPVQAVRVLETGTDAIVIGLF